MPDLTSTLDLLHRHHRQNGAMTSRGGGASSAEFHSVWGLRDVREAATSGDTEASDWLTQHHNLITAVEACHKIRLADALQR